MSVGVVAEALLSTKSAALAQRASASPRKFESLTAGWHRVAAPDLLAGCIRSAKTGSV